MKKMTKGLGLMLCGSLLLQGCYGNFALVRKLYAWNGTVGDKWVQSLVMFALNVIPVYAVAGAVDYVILNTVQFWTGKNPVAMTPGEKEIQTVMYEGKKYQLTATANRLEVLPLDGKSAPASLVFDPATRSWSAESKERSNRLVQMVGASGELADVIYPDGHKERVELTAN